MSFNISDKDHSHLQKIPEFSDTQSKFDSLCQEYVQSPSVNRLVAIIEDASKNKKLTIPQEIKAQVDSGVRLLEFVSSHKGHLFNKSEILLIDPDHALTIDLMHALLKEKPIRFTLIPLLADTGKIREVANTQILQENDSAIKSKIHQIQRHCSSLIQMGFSLPCLEFVAQQKDEDQASYIKRQTEELTELNQVLNDESLAILDKANNSCTQILKHYYVEKGMLMLKSSNIQTGYEAANLAKSIHIASDKLARSGAHDVELPSTKIIATQSSDTRRYSIIGTQFSKPLGAGNVGTVVSQESLTRGKRVASKKSLELMKKEVENLERFLKYTEVHKQMLPGLPFLPIQILLHRIESFYGGNRCYISEQYDGDLFQWIQDQTTPKSFSVRMDIAFQTLYMGAFCEIVGFMNPDTKPDNIFVKKTEDGHIKIFFGDLGSGLFADNATIDERHDISIAAAGLTPKDEVEAIKDKTRSSAENWKSREQLFVYQLGCVLFSTFVGGFPHKIVGGFPEFPTNGAVTIYRNWFIRKLKGEGVSEETSIAVMNLIEQMIKKENRITCREAFKILGDIIENDVKLKDLFSELGYVIPSTREQPA